MPEWPIRQWESWTESLIPNMTIIKFKESPATAVLLKQEMIRDDRGILPYYQLHQNTH
jgi:hypothetical protein